MKILSKLDGLIISIVPVTMLDIIWPMIIPILQRVEDEAPTELTVSSTKNRLLLGECQLVIITEDTSIVAINTIEVRVKESGLRYLDIPITGGDRLNEWLPRFLDFAKQVARSCNCTELRGATARKGWMKILKSYGWEEALTIIKCDVGE